VARTYLTRGKIVLSMVPAGRLELTARPHVAYTNVTPLPEKQVAETQTAATPPAAATNAKTTPRAVPPVGASDTSADRFSLPVVPAATPLSFPHVQRRLLANGVPIVIVEDHTRPLVSVSTIVRTPGLLDPPGKVGLGKMVADLLSEGTTTATADQLADAVAAVGSPVSATGFFTMTANVDTSLALMATQFLHPAFPQDALNRAKANTIAEFEQAKDQPGYLATRVVQEKLYGTSHPYGRHATAADITAITRDDLVAYYTAYYRPPNITVVVAGDLTPDEAVSKLTRVFGALTPGTPSDRHPSLVAPPGPTTVYLYDRPGAPQSVVLATAIGPARTTPDYYAIDLMNTVLGGAFNSRINLNLREQHHYSYGASSSFIFRPPPEPSTFQAKGSFITAKTDSALIELVGELTRIRTTQPITAADVIFAKGLSLQLENIQQRATSVSRLVVNYQTIFY
jgi:zinc protease